MSVACDRVAEQDWHADQHCHGRDDRVEKADAKESSLVWSDVGNVTEPVERPARDGNAEGVGEFGQEVGEAVVDPFTAFARHLFVILNDIGHHGVRQNPLRGEADAEHDGDHVDPGGGVMRQKKKASKKVMDARINPGRRWGLC